MMLFFILGKKKHPPKFFYNWEVIIIIGKLLFLKNIFFISLKSNLKKKNSFQNYTRYKSNFISH